MSKAKLPEPPAHLKAEGRELWRCVVAEYDLPPDALVLLRMACEAWDRCCAARRALDRHGLTCKDRFGQLKARPEIVIERDSREACARRLKQLGLDLEPMHDRPGRPAGR